MTCVDRVGVRKPFIRGSALLLALASCSAIYLPVPLGWPLMAAIAISTGGKFPLILAFFLEILPTGPSGRRAARRFLSYIGGLLGLWLAGHIADSTASLDLALVLLGGGAILWARTGFFSAGNRPFAADPS